MFSEILSEPQGSRILQLVLDGFVKSSLLVGLAWASGVTALVAEHHTAVGHQHLVFGILQVRRFLFENGKKAMKRR